MRQRAQFGVVSQEKVLGALPVVAGFCSRLKIRGIVDDACPVRDLAQLTHGQVIEALVANRLTSPAPLVHIQSWARDWAVGEALGWSLNCSMMTGSGGRWMRSPRIWTRSPGRSGWPRSRSSGSM